MPWIKRYFHKIRLIVVLLTMVLAYQNCGKKFKSSDSSSNKAQNQPPPTEVLFDIRPPSFSTSKNADFEFHSTTPEPLVCNVDGTISDPCYSPKTLSALAEGEHTYTVQLKRDPSIARQYQWTVDSIAPVVTITDQPPAVTALSSVNIGFTVVDATVVTNECRLNGTVISPCTSPVALSGLTPGSYVFAFRSTDQAGNSTPKNVSFTVDQSVWTVVFTAKPDAFINQSGTTFLFRALNPTGVAQTTTFKCALDSGAFAPCGSLVTGTIDPTYSQSVSSLAQGAHSFKVKAMQPNGLETAEAVYTWTVDLTPPVISITAPVGRLIGGVTFNFTVTDAQSGIKSTACDFTSKTRVDGCASGITYSGLMVGSYTFTVSAMDKAGNIASQDFTVQVAETAPLGEYLGSQEVEAKTIGTRFYLLTKRGFGIYDLSSGSPVKISYSPWPQTGGFWPVGDAKTFTVKGNFVYLTSLFYLLIYDITDAAHPLLVYKRNLPFIAFIHAAGNFLFLGDGDGKLSQFNIANPASPVEMAPPLVAGPAGSSSLWALSVNHILNVNGLFATGTASVRALEISQPSMPVNHGTHTVPYSIEKVTIKANATNLVIAERLGYGSALTDLTMTFNAYDLSQLPAAMPLMSSKSLAAEAGGFGTGNWNFTRGHLYVPQYNAAGTAQLVAIYDVSNSFNRVGAVSLPLRMELFEILKSNDNKLYVRQDDELEISAYSLATAAAPAIQFSFKTMHNQNLYFYDFGNELVINGPTAYLWSFKAIHVIDLSNPLNPVFVQSVPTTVERMQYMYVSDNRLYVHGYRMQDYKVLTDEMIEQFDISDPKNPSFKNRLSNQPKMKTFAKGDRLFRMTNDNISAFDLSQAGQVVAKGVYTFPEVRRRDYGAAISGTHIYVFMEQSGLPDHPFLIDLDYSGGTLTEKSNQVLNELGDFEWAQPIVFGNYLYVFGSKALIFEITPAGLVAKPTVDQNFHVSNSYFASIKKGNDVILTGGASINFLNPLTPTSTQNYFSRPFQCNLSISQSGLTILGFGDGFDSY